MNLRKLKLPALVVCLLLLLGGTVPIIRAAGGFIYQPVNICDASTAQQCAGVDASGGQHAIYVEMAAGTATVDPCLSSAIAKSSTAISVTTATTTALVSAVTNKQVDVCSFSMGISGTTPGAAFEYGTKVSTDCDTGTTALTGLYTGATGTDVTDGFGGTIFRAPPSNELCLVTTGTPSVKGVVTYVQQ